MLGLRAQFPHLAGVARTVARAAAACVALPVVILVRAIRPLLLIRFGPMMSDRIGHFAANTEVYLCERDAGLYRRRSLDIFYHVKPVSNEQLRIMWDRILWVSRFASELSRWNRLLPGGSNHVIDVGTNLGRSEGARDIHNVLARFPPHLSFTAEEEGRGYEELDRLGIGPVATFVAFHARDSAYLRAHFPERPAEFFRYHDYRNTDVASYVPAMEEVVRRGHFAVRMGKVVARALDLENPGIIDYATSGRSDFMDIYLGARSHFFVSSGSGLDAIATVFRRPVAYVNFIPLEQVHSWNPQDLAIFRKLWLTRERRFLSWREIVTSGVGRFQRLEQYEAAGIEIVNNTPEEIRALVIEMDDRVAGRWRQSAEDQDLQRRFWSLFPSSDWHGQIFAHVGAEFLRQNQGLLE